MKRAWHGGRWSMILRAVSGLFLCAVALNARAYFISIDNGAAPVATLAATVSEVADIALGGFTQRSSRVVLIDAGNPSDCELTNWRVRVDVAGAAGSKTIECSGYTLPNPAGTAWHVLSGSVTLLGPIGSFATVVVSGSLDFEDTVGTAVTVFKTSDALVYEFFSRSENTFFDPPFSPLHTRSATYDFSVGGGALPGSEIRMTASGLNPFVVPEPGTAGMVGIGLLTLGVLWRGRYGRRTVSARSPLPYGSK